MPETATLSAFASCIASQTEISGHYWLPLAITPMLSAMLHAIADISLAEGQLMP